MNGTVNVLHARAQKTVLTQNQKDKTFAGARNHYSENSKYAQTVWWSDDKRTTVPAKWG